MINIVSESGGCCSDIFERKGEVAGVALMWLFPCTPPPAAAVSHQAQSGVCRAGSAPFTAFPRASQHHLLRAVPQHRDVEEGEGIPPLGSLDCRGSQGSEPKDAHCADRVGFVLSSGRAVPTPRWNCWFQSLNENSPTRPISDSPEFVPRTTGCPGVSVPAHSLVPWCGSTSMSPSSSTSVLLPAKAWENISAPFPECLCHSSFHLCCQCSKHGSGYTTPALLGGQDKLLAPISSRTVSSWLPTFLTFEMLPFRFSHLFINIPRHTTGDPLWDMSTACFCLCLCEENALFFFFFLLFHQTAQTQNFLRARSTQDHLQWSSSYPGQAQTNCGWAPRPATRFPP